MPARTPSEPLELMALRRGSARRRRDRPATSLGSRRSEPQDRERGQLELHRAGLSVPSLRARLHLAEVACAGAAVALPVRVEQLLPGALVGEPDAIARLRLR